MKKIKIFLTLFVLSLILNIAHAAEITLYKDLYYGMTKNDIAKRYQFEIDENNNNDLYVYNQSFLGFNWDIRLSLDNNEQLESVFLATEMDNNGNKLSSVMPALNKNFSAVYAANDDDVIDLFYIIKKNGYPTYQKAIGDFVMKSMNTSSTLNIISINNDSLQKTTKIANTYIDLLQKAPLNTRQAELILQSYEDGSILLAIDFSAPKMLLQKMQSQPHEEF